MILHVLFEFSLICCNFIVIIIIKLLIFRAQSVFFSPTSLQTAAEVDLLESAEPGSNLLEQKGRVWSEEERAGAEGRLFGFPPGSAAIV